MKTKMQDEIVPEDARKEAFDLFFRKKIEPLIDTQNKQKDKYRGRFWCFFWTMIFLLAVNTLIVLYMVILHHRPLSVVQLLLIVAAATCIVLFPLYTYKKIKKIDIFRVFLGFFGAWKYNENIQNVSAEILPSKKTIGVVHNISQQYLGVDLSIGNLVEKKHRIKHDVCTHPSMIGTFLSFTFSNKLDDKILMFEQHGLYSKSKYPSMVSIGQYINFPAANYFNIFAAQAGSHEDLLCARFFEDVLDLKEIFGAKKIYVLIDGKKMHIFLSGSQFYFNHNRIWSKKINKDRFDVAYRQVEQVYEFAEDVLAMLQRQRARR